MKIHAAVVVEFGKPLEVEQLEVPVLKCGQVLVKIYCSGICGAQLHHMDGVGVRKEFLPFLLGHEGGGEVVETGSSVRNVKPGDRVVLHWRPGVGIESEFPKYTRSDGSIVGGGLVTTFSDYAVISENRMTKIGNDIPYEIAALMGCCVTTGLGLINNEAKLKIGQSIVVIGCGGVGLSIIQGASMVSGNPIVAIDVDDNKLVLAEGCGATHTIYNCNMGRKTTYSEVEKVMHHCSGADVCVDTTGNIHCIEMAHIMTKAGGKTIMVGQPKPNQDITFHSAFQHFKGKTLIDSEGGQTNPTADIPKYLELYRQGKFDPSKLIAFNEDVIFYGLQEINKAMDLLRSGSILGRAMLSP